MAKIKNKKTGEIREVSDKELKQYGLGGKLPKAKLGKDVDPFMQNAIGNRINYWEERNANGELPQQINLGNVGGQSNLPKFVAQDYGDIDESQFGQQNPNYTENPFLTQEIVKEPDYKNSLKLKNQIEDYRNPSSQVNFKKPSLSMFPTMGNKYLNRGMQYLNQSIAHANAIGTDPNSWEQPLNYQNGISNNPFLSTDVNKKYTTLRPKQDTYTLPTEDVQLPETQQSLTPKLTKFGDGGNLKNAYAITADALSLFPPTSVAGYVMGLPTTAYDMYQDYQKGDNKQLALDAMGLIPAFKLMKYSKFAKSATQGINMASKFNKAVDVANMANDVNQTIEKKELGGKSTYKKTMGDGGMNQNQFNNLQALGTGVNATQSGINFGKGTLDMIGSMNQNNQVQNMENQLYTQSVFSGNIDNRPMEQYGYNWSGRNALAENGMQIREIVKNGKPNINMESKEHVKLPNGFSQEMGGNITHAMGGIDVNLPIGTKIYSKKLTIPNKELLKLKNSTEEIPQAENGVELTNIQKTPSNFSFLDSIKIPEKGKMSIADIAKPFETKKNVDMLNFKKGDSIQKRTAQLMIDKKNENLNQLFDVAENLKMNGYFGKDVQKETMEEYQQPEMAFGGNIMTEKFSNLPMAGSGLETKPENTFTGVNKGIDFKTLRLSKNSKNRRNNFLPFDPTNTPDIYGDPAYRESVFKEFEDRTGIKLNRANSDAVNLESIRKYQNARTPELTKDYKLNFTRGNQDLYNEFTKQKGYKKSKDSTKESNAFYDWAVANKKLNKDYADSGKWGHEYYNTAPLNFETEAEYNKWKQDPDWEQVGNRFVDRSGDPNGMITYYDIHKNWKTPSTKKTEGTPVTNEVQKIVDRQPEYNINPNMDIQFPLPNVYGRTPLNYYQTDPNYINPRYLDVQSQLNEVSRGQRAFQNNLGSRGNTEMGNLLQSQANAYNQQNQIFGNKFNYDRNQDSQTQQFNANAKTQNDMYNQGAWYNQLEDPIRRRESNIGVQQLTDQYRGQERADQALAFKNTKEFMDKDYSYFTNLSPEAQVAYMEVLSKQKQPTKKYGGKVKIKPTLKKKK